MLIEGDGCVVFGVNDLFDSLCALNAPRTGGGFESEKPALHFGEEARRQEAVGDRAVVLIADAAQIGAWPVEQIAFGEDDPRAFSVEAEMFLDGGRQFERGVEAVRRAVRDGNDKDLVFVVMAVRRQNDGARAVFRAFLTAFVMFAQPEIRIPNDEAEFRLW